MTSVAAVWHPISESTSVVVYNLSLQDNSGLFGLQDDVTKTKTPVLIYDSTKLVPVVKLSSGNDHLVLLTERGEVLTLGNAEQGQLGRVAGSFSSRGGRRGKNYLLEPKVCMCIQSDPRCENVINLCPLACTLPKRERF